MLVVRVSTGDCTRWGDPPAHGVQAAPGTEETLATDLLNAAPLGTSRGRGQGQRFAPAGQAGLELGQQRHDVELLGIEDAVAAGRLRGAINLGFR